MIEIQNALHERAKNTRDARMRKVNSYDEFKESLETSGVGNFLLAHWDGTSETEKKIKDETKATIRCIPFDAEQEEGKCILTGRPSSQRVVFARAY